MNRADKINMLKNIATGRANVTDFTPKLFAVRLGYEKGPNHFINGKPVDPDKFYSEKGKHELIHGTDKITFAYGPEED